MPALSHENGLDAIYGERIDASDVGDLSEVLNQPQDNRKTFSVLLERKSVRTLRAANLEDAKERVQKNVSPDMTIIGIKEGEHTVDGWE